MSIARKLLRGTAKGLYTRLMDKVGSRVVAVATDTSSDAPDAFYAPKRNLYAQMVSEEQDGEEDEAAED